MNKNMNEMQKAFPEGSFCCIFWDQLLENTKEEDACQYRQVASTYDQMVFKFEAYVKQCLSCHAVEWFCDTTIGKDSGIIPTTSSVYQVLNRKLWT